MNHVIFNSLGILSILSILCLTSAIDFSLQVGFVSIPTSVDAYTVAIPSKEENSFIKDIACSTPFTCVIYYMMKIGVSSISDSVNVRAFSNPYSDIELVQGVNEIRSSESKVHSLIKIFPDIASLIIPKSDFEPDIEILWNRTHYIFVAILPSFKNEAQIKESTYPLLISYCLPFIKNNYLSRCSSQRPNLWSEIIPGFRVIFHDVKLKQIRNISNWWTPISDGIVPEIAIGSNVQELIHVSQDFTNNFFSSVVVGHNMAFQIGVQIELRKYGTSLHGEKLVVSYDGINIVTIEPNTVLFIFNKTSGKEYPVFGYTKNLILKDYIPFNSSKDELGKILESVIATLPGAYKVINWVIENYPMILTIIAITIIGMAIVYVLTLIQPIISLVSSFSSRLISRIC